VKTKIEQLMQESGVGFGTSGARGLVSAMTDRVCYAYACAFLQVLKAGGVAPMRVVIGHDLRPSSPAIAAACAAAVRDAGAELVYAGCLPTPALAWYANQLNAPAIVVTGSHIPFDRNGIKFYRAEGEISKADEQAIAEAEVTIPEPLLPVSLPAPTVAAAGAYIERYTGFFAPDALQGLRVALYAHSSVARDLLPQILQALGADVVELGRTDTFVPIDTEAVRPEDIAQARRWAEEQGFDAIVSTDGDADRPLIGDERGQWLRGDIVGILCARSLGAESVVTPVSSNTAVERCGAFKQVLRTRIGSPYVIAGMQQLAGLGSSVVGYEANGGFLLGCELTREGRTLGALPTRDAVLPMLALLADAKARGVPLSALSGDLPARFTASDRLQNFATATSRALIAQLCDDPRQAAQVMAPKSGDAVDIDLTDGLRIGFANGDIVHLRPSGNAPELRCYAEADSSEGAMNLCQGCIQQLQQYISL